MSGGECPRKKNETRVEGGVLLRKVSGQSSGRVSYEQKPKQNAKAGGRRVLGGGSNYKS